MNPSSILELIGTLIGLVRTDLIYLKQGINKGGYCAGLREHNQDAHEKEQ